MSFPFNYLEGEQLKQIYLTVLVILTVFLMIPVAITMILTEICLWWKIFIACRAREETWKLMVLRQNIRGIHQHSPCYCKRWSLFSNKTGKAPYILTPQSTSININQQQSTSINKSQHQSTTINDINQQQSTILNIHQEQSTTTLDASHCPFCKSPHPRLSLHSTFVVKPFATQHKWPLEKGDQTNGQVRYDPTGTAPKQSVCFVY